MVKLLAAFAFGFALAWSVQSWRVSQPQPHVSPAVDEAGPESPGEQLSSVKNPPIESERRVSAKGSQPVTVEPARAAGERNSKAKDGHIANPITLPETHAGFVRPQRMSMADIHRKIEREDIDSGWAPIAEDLLTRYLTTHEHSQSIVIAALNCRSTRCELAGSVFGETPGEQWRVIRQGLLEQGWYSEYFDASSSETGGTVPGEYRFITVFPRVGTQMEAPINQ